MGKDKIAQEFYQQVGEEMATGNLQLGTMAKATEAAHGDEQKARSLYIKYRVAQLSKAFALESEQRRLEGARARGEAQCPHCGYLGNPVRYKSSGILPVAVVVLVMVPTLVTTRIGGSLIIFLVGAGLATGAFVAVSVYEERHWAKSPLDHCSKCNCPVDTG